MQLIKLKHLIFNEIIIILLVSSTNLSNLYSFYDFYSVSFFFNKFKGNRIGTHPIKCDPMQGSFKICLKCTIPGRYYKPHCCFLNIFLPRFISHLKICGLQRNI